MTDIDIEETEERTQEEISTNNRIRQIAWIVVGAAVVFFLGLGSGYLKWGQDETAEAKQQKERVQLYEHVKPKEGYNLSISYGDLGPRLLEGGVINYDVIGILRRMQISC